MFCKAQMSALTATAVDFALSFILKEGLGWWYAAACGAGAVAGGVTNAFINYRWVFHSHQDCKWAMALRFLLVWGTSILLNTAGTYVLTEWSGIYFIISKTAVAVAVAWLWNYPMQHCFVFPDNNRHIISNIKEKNHEL